MFKNIIYRQIYIITGGITREIGSDYYKNLVNDFALFTFTECLKITVFYPEIPHNTFYGFPAPMFTTEKAQTTTAINSHRVLTRLSTLHYKRIVKRNKNNNNKNKTETELRHTKAIK